MSERRAERNFDGESPSAFVFFREPSRHGLGNTAAGLHGRLAHRVVVLDAGRIIEEGSPAALLARAEGHYQRMMRLFRREEWVPVAPHP